MFEFKKQCKIIYFFLIIFLGISFIFSNNRVMAMNNNEVRNINDLSIEEIKNNIKNKIDEILSQIKKLSDEILQYDRLNLNTMNLKKKLKYLDIKIKKFYIQIGLCNTLIEINQQIWDFSYKRQQLIIKINSPDKEHFDIENCKQITIKVIKLQNKQKELIKKLKH
ncbi:hypothetical protein AYWB_294 [Aster yellows witches'-broom phytoplasma AYWB]|uniref:Sequence-variable mosaic (SVM) signal sequence domain-containing protein n=1 Tax=Aster yellows witches'-broom phytoplasma (strain AYWB) TaxID=322098 RepID=Q2NJI2_AYWBP|nr:SVM family protein [Aster yellows witches'-broom phytoplasma]ABC65411.1 hypothetical protein AYWB_294 [Aster yellows witches'-broom phytoplasma AYWB]